MIAKTPRGTKDILPEDIGKWLFVEEKIREIGRRYGYSEIRTPMFEQTELFWRGIGDATDVVEKEMYTFTDRGGQSLTLRPENTASAVRAYVEHKLYASSSVARLFYIGSMFRYDRPQKGRFREFHQFGVEAIGEAQPGQDAEVIVLAMRFLESLGLGALSLEINSVGDHLCRPAYRERLRDFLSERRDELCEDCLGRYERNPLRVLDCKKEHCQEILSGMPLITDSLCDDCRTHFEKVQDYLSAAGISYTLNPKLVRGLDYYTRTAFEIKCASLGAQSSIAGGGRYDGLVEEIGGSPTPAVGFAVGLERVMLALSAEGLFPTSTQAADAFVIALGDVARSGAFSLTEKLRSAGLAVLTDYSGRSLKSAMKQADKSGARFTLILGEDEIKSGVVSLRDMKGSLQESVRLDEVASTLKARAT